MQSSPLEKITRVRVPGKQPSDLWDITIKEGRIASVEAHDQSASGLDQDGILDGSSRLIAPSLCHAHIHLDKCFLLQDPKYSDLQIETGDFQEAMQMTSTAKARFEEEDLVRRGSRLIEESIQHGVTAMRAFVEVDGVVELKCLDAGLKLRKQYKARCDIQICAFAQLPLFSGEDDGAEVRKLMEVAATKEDVHVLGSTPYVEDNESKSKDNAQWISALALRNKKHLDLHLDYFLDEDKQPLMWEVLKTLKDQSWTEAGGKQITLGHCTRLTRFQERDWNRLKQEVGELVVSFVGLPTSDLFMMRSADNVRGTLPIIELIKRYGFNAAIAVNNVGNAFTPQGNCDPLSIAQLGVGLYQAPTKGDVQLLYEAVSSRAKAAIGHESTSLDFEPGEPADFVLFDGLDNALPNTPSPDETLATDPLDGLRAASLAFLFNIKVSHGKRYVLRQLIVFQDRFGKNSSQLYDVHSTLDTFKRGEMSKRDAHKIIVNTLKEHDDLRHQLMNVFMHPGADWAPDDFDLPFEAPTQPLVEPAPQFLHPAHQPQIRLPSISSSWFTPAPTDQSPGQMAFSGYDVYNTMVSSPWSPGLPPLQQSQTQNHSCTNHNVNNMDAAIGDYTRVPAPVHTVFRNPWQDTSYAEIWANNGMHFPAGGTYMNEQFEPPQSPYSGPVQPSVLYFQDAEPFQMPNSLPQEAFPSMPASRLGHDLTPSSNNWSTSAGLRQEHPMDYQPLPNAAIRSSPNVEPTLDVEDSSRDIPADRPVEALYVHSLCGKGFATLSGVKKHHWGKRINDPATTTGCWAKHRKPDVTWDDHPSCKGRQPVPETNRGVSSSSKSKVLDLQPKVPTNSTLLQYDTLPGFPTLHDLPNTVAKTLSASDATIPGPEEWKPPHHASQLAPRSSFDSLLTAVNMASQIDATKSEAQEDSVTPPRDVKVAAAKHHHAPFVPYIPPIVPVAIKKNVSDVGEATQDLSRRFRTHGAKDQPSVRSIDAQESYASAASSQPFKPLRSQPSAPAQRKRKI
ncbi:hypothetical protein OPT61_g3332 [Boeremia exigua]|uniref:Uncharacterized protein n=1 Tax=Boeremia exigua TaxID=749465 RepID=A0ACC2II65_9PLEO|nr:hypothetical protein OPT61_g3332 [Boeremia exigua]